MAISSPLIQNVENLYNLPDALSALGYNSVFDVVRIPRAYFVRQHRDTLGKDAGEIYDVLIGYALQVANQFRHNRPQRAVNIAAQGPFSKGGPDYPSQFLDAKTGWTDKAPNGSPEANDGPIAYLAYIYGNVLQQEIQLTDGTRAMNKLNQRRPDIGALIIDDKAINEEIPQIQLVNEVLASAVQASQTNLHNINDINRLLATTRYPNTLPYNYPNQQIQVVKSALDIDPMEYLMAQDIALLQGLWAPAATTLSDAQAADLTRLQVMASGFGPEQQNTIVETAPAGAQFYLENFGSGNLTATSFSSMDVLTSRTGLTVPDVEQLFCATAGGNGTFTVETSNNVLSPSISPVPSEFGAKFINAGSEHSIYLQKAKDGSLQVMLLSDDGMDRINRTVRLKKWLGLPFKDVDLLVTSAMIAADAGGSLLEMDDNTLRTLGVFCHYQKKYGVSAKQFSAWLNIVTPYSIAPEIPFFDQVFNSTKAFDTPLIIDMATTFDPTATSGADAVIVQKICGPLGLGRQEFLAIAQSVLVSLGGGTTTLTCELPVVSAFYRVTTLARALGMSVGEFLALARLLDQGTNTVLSQLTGSPVVSIPQKGATLATDFLTLLISLSQVSSWLQNRKLSCKVASTMATPITASLQANTLQILFVQDVAQQLASTLVTDPTQLFNDSGAPLLDDRHTSIDWAQLLAGDGKLIDTAGLVTDLIDDVQNVGPADIPIAKLIVTTVEAQDLGPDEKINTMELLNAAVLEARQPQMAVTATALTKMLVVPQSLSMLLLRWAGQTSYKWLQATLWANAVSASGDGLATQIWGEYLQMLGEVVRRELVRQQFSISAACLQYLLDSPDKFGLPSPYNGDVNLETLYLLGRYDDFLHQVGGAQGGTEDDVLAYLLNASYMAQDTAGGMLAKLLGWNVGQIQDGSVLFGGPPNSVPQIDAVMRLQQAQQDTGLTVDQQRQAFALDRDSAYDAWQAVGQAMIVGSTHTGTALFDSGTTPIDMSGSAVLSIRLSITPQTALADGKTALQCAAKVTMGDGSPAPDGMTVTFTATNGATANPPSAQTSGGQGQSVTTITSTVPGDSNVTATASGVSSNTEPVLFTEKAVEAVSLSVTPETAPADGQSALQGTATVTMSDGSPAPDGMTVTFTPTNGATANPVSAPTSGGQGQATTKITSTVPGISEVTANASDVLSTSVAVTFTGKTVQTVSLDVNPRTATADGQSPLAATATVTMSDGHPAPDGMTVTFTPTNGATASPPSAPTSGGKGQASTKITSMVTCDSEVTAIAGDVPSNTVPVTFTDGQTVQTVGLSIDPLTAPADGQSALKGTATVTMSDGSPAPDGVTVTFLPTNSATADPASAPASGGKGQAITNITSTVPGDCDVTATSGNVPSKPVSVTFTDDRTVQSVVLTVIPPTATTDGTGGMQGIAIVTMSDGSRAPDGTIVTFAPTNGAVADPSTPLTSGGNGWAVTQITSTVAGNSKITATCDGVPSNTVPVLFTTEQPVEEVDLTITPKTAVADGNSALQATATVTMLDGTAAPDGTIVTFAPTNGAVANPSSPATSGGNGQATTSITSKFASDSSVVATAGGIPSDPVQVMFTTTQAVGSVALSLDKTTAVADDKTPVHATATVTMANGTPAPDGTAVTFAPTNGAVANPPSSFTSGGTGQATTQITSRLTCSSDVTATAQGVSSTPVPVQFTDGETVLTVTLLVIPDWGPADGKSKLKAIASVTVDQGLPAPDGVVVGFSTDIGTANPSQTVTSGGLGLATTDITSTEENEGSVYASANGVNSNSVPIGFSSHKK